ncbi:MAG: hypothetical protein H7X93_11040, partial [Sphingomonadaceae bacterium]|nr:hypothetical protein [Sphingomonadaceae bacterium]
MFLNALARTGNVGRACEESGAPKSMVYRRRRIDAGFAAAWETALGAAREALTDFIDPTAGSGCTAGSRGGWVRRLRKGQPQIARAPAKAWTEAKEGAFLDTLAEQCHVGRAAAAVADVVVVNHHLLAADLSVRQAQDNWQDAAVLPPYQRLILDEAHHLEDVAANHLGIQVTSRAVRRLLGRFERNGRGLAPTLS